MNSLSETTELGIWTPKTGLCKKGIDSLVQGLAAYLKKKKLFTLFSREAGFSLPVLNFFILYDSDLKREITI